MEKKNWAPTSTSTSSKLRSRRNYQGSSNSCSIASRSYSAWTSWTEIVLTIANTRRGTRLLQRTERDRDCLSMQLWRRFVTALRTATTRCSLKWSRLCSRSRLQSIRKFMNAHSWRRLRLSILSTWRRTHRSIATQQRLPLPRWSTLFSRKWTPISNMAVKSRSTS